ncbi:MAG: hypothetical protein ISS50_05380 [Anaerolineae bacterium]|nr:hypothetical protein [Anaerolineae bacterium]
MKRGTAFIVVVLIVALVSGAGYLGFRSTQTGGRLDIAAEFQSVLGRLGLHRFTLRLTVQ